MPPELACATEGLRRFFEIDSAASANVAISGSAHLADALLVELAPSEDDQEQISSARLRRRSNLFTMRLRGTSVAANSVTESIVADIVAQALDVKLSALDVLRQNLVRGQHEQTGIAAGSSEEDRSDALEDEDRIFDQQSFAERIVRHELVDTLDQTTSVRGCRRRDKRIAVCVKSPREAVTHCKT